MNVLYNLYIRFMVWLGAAPPPGYDHFVRDTIIETQKTDSNLPEKDDNLLQEEGTHLKTSPRPSSLLTCAKIFGGWTGGILGGLVSGIVISLLIGCGLGLCFGVYLGLMTFLDPNELSQNDPLMPFVILFLSTVLLGMIFTVIFGLPIGVPLGIFLGIVGGVANTAFQIIQYEDKKD
ncbi:MAG: hypothetical protein GY797_12105 [Deltaproteobacteria bacterium]|nr:hypothetical protein [Deltaproteobacteria bacterium]MCP4986410.1 hypothetical protein [Colwellia sp.]